MASILIVDDEAGICTSLTFALEDRYQVRSATSVQQALHLMGEETFNLCLLDLRVGPRNGLDLLREIKQQYEQMIVIMMTAYGTIDTSVEAIRMGAYTYLTKPLNIGELYLVIEQALEHQRLHERVQYLSDQLEARYCRHGIIGKSPAMQSVFTMIEKLKDVDSSVIITGESGTGKELVAKALHYSGRRKKETLEEVNCAAIPETLLESELFGHKRGAFTGAVSDRMGKLEHANRGTIFLDEIGDMPLPLQAKILRVLQEKEYTPLGSLEKRKLDIRVLAATNRDLAQMVQDGEFRSDLYFRLNVVEIHLPPLRERQTDLPLLFEHFIQHNNEVLGKQITGISADAERRLFEFDYPGNVRQLSNILERAMVLCGGDTIQLEDLPVRMQKPPAQGEHPPSGLFLEDLTGLPLKEVEKRVIRAALEKNHGRRMATASMLGISEKGLRNKINEYHLK